MQELPLVTLLIISYNQKAYIHDCMKGLLSQTYPNVEILYLDDCSPDQTFEEAVKYESMLKQKYGDVRVRFIRNQENRGLIKNLNWLVLESKGIYIKFMAADDFMFENAIEKIVACMEAHKEYDLLYTNGIYGDGSARFPLKSIDGLKQLYYGKQPAGERLFDELYQKDFIAAPTVIVRKDVYDRYGMYDDQIGIEDWDFYLRIAEHGCIGYLDEITVMYRFTNDSLSHSDNPARRMNMQKSTLMIREKYREKVQGSRELINRSLNDAFQDAVHIGDKEYFEFLWEYAGRNRVKISGKNRIRYVMYSLHIFKILEYLVH